MRRILCQVAQVTATKGAEHLKTWYAHVKTRRGSKKAIVALGRKILVISWAMLRDNTTFQDPDQPEQTHQPTALHRHKLRAMVERAQRSAKTISVWEAIHHLSTDQKLRTELGLITIKPTTQKPA